MEVDVDPPLRFRVENGIVLTPVTFYVLTLHRSDLFAGKMHAILYRAWKGRVKGRDWYDLQWYIQNKIPLSLPYLAQRMKQAGNLEQDESLDKSRLLEMLKDKMRIIDWQSAKSDMRVFIPDPQGLEIWSEAYFSELLSHLITQ